VLQSVAWSLGCTVVALAGARRQHPLWLIPPLVLVVPPLIWGWLTYRVFSFDVLATHASPDERRTLMAAHRWPLFGAGVVAGYLGAAPSLLWAMGALTLVFAPLLISVSVWLYTLVFAFSALWFAHYLLAALRDLRAVAAAPGRSPAPPPSRCSSLPPLTRIARSMKFGLLVIGDEILSGKRADKHLPKVIELLAARGLALSWARSAGDDRERITADLKDAVRERRRGLLVRRHRRDARRPHPAVRRRRRSACRSRCIRRRATSSRADARRRARAGQALRARARGQPAPASTWRSSPRARDHPEPVQQDRRLLDRRGEGGVFFVPGFPVMAWPMIEWVLDTAYAHLHADGRHARALGDRVRRDGGGADAAHGSDRGGLSRGQGVQPAERRPSRVGPAHRARGQGRPGVARPGLPA
jgi:hypothetical protein